MLLLVGRLQVPREHRDAFQQLIPQLVSSTRGQSGCLGFDILQDTTEANVFVMLERWRDREALNAHTNSPVYTENDGAVTQLVPEVNQQWDEYEVAG